MTIINDFYSILRPMSKS